MTPEQFANLFKSNFFTREQVGVLRRLWQAMFVDPLLSGAVRIAGALLPASDNSVPLGSLTARFTEVFAVNGVINTSDARMKTCRLLSVPETDAAIEMSQRIHVFEWLSERGSGKLHIGMTVQDAMEILAKHGLHWRNYEFIHAEQDAFGFNSHELAMFIAAGMNERLLRLERV